MGLAPARPGRARQSRGAMTRQRDSLVACTRIVLPALMWRSGEARLNVS